MKCPLCNNEIGIFRNRLSLDGVLCKKCSDKIIEETYSKYSSKVCKNCLSETKYYDDFDFHKCEKCGKIYSVKEASKMRKYESLEHFTFYIIENIAYYIYFSIFVYYFAVLIS